MKEEIIPFIQPTYRNIGISHNDHGYYDNDNNNKQQISFKLTTCNDPYYQHLKPQCPKSIANHLRTFNNMQKDSKYAIDQSSNTCNHSMIRLKAQERVLGMLLKDEMKQIEEAKLLQDIMAKNEEIKAQALIKEQAKHLGNTFRKIKFEEDQAEKIMTTRAKLNKANNIIKDNKSISYSKNSTITDGNNIDESCSNTSRITKQRKFDFSSNLVNTIRNKTNVTTVVTTIYNNNLPYMKTKSTVKSKKINNTTNTNTNATKEKKEPKVDQLKIIFKVEENNKPSMKQEKRMKDLKQFVSNFNLKA